MWARGSPVFFAQRLIWSWMTARSFFDPGLLADFEAGIAQRQHHVVRQDEAVPAEPAQQILPGIAAEPAAVLAEIGHQPDLVVGRPAGEEFAETAMLLGDAFDEGGVVAHRPDLLRVAHDAAVGGEVVPEIVGLEQQPLRLEAEEGLLETRPFLLDHPPHEAGRENALGDRRQDAVVRNAWRSPHCPGSRRATIAARHRRPCALPRAHGFSRNLPFALPCRAVAG